MPLVRITAKSSANARTMIPPDEPDQDHVRHCTLECRAAENLDIVCNAVKRPVRYIRRHTLNSEEAHDHCTQNRVQIHDEQTSEIGDDKPDNKCLIFFLF